MLADLYLKLTTLAEKVFAPFGNLVLLVLRLVWGWQFLTTGLGKLQNHARVTEFFTSLGIPMPGLNAWFVGGLDSFLKADAFWFFFVSVVVLTLGPGAISLDRFLTKAIRERREREAQAVRLGAQPA